VNYKLCQRAKGSAKDFFGYIMCLISLNYFLTTVQDQFERLLVKPSWSATVCTALGLEGFKTPLAVHPEPALHGGDAELLQTITGKIMLAFGLFSKVLILGPCGLGQHGADELVAF
jgi:hypothetical protein